MLVVGTAHELRTSFKHVPYLFIPIRAPYTQTQCTYKIIEIFIYV